MSTQYPFFCGTFAVLLVCAPSLAGSVVSSGLVSWYGAWHEGRRTSSGCIFHAADLTAASPTLPMGTLLRVSRGDHSVVVQVTDRGPFVAHRILDLSYGAAKRLDMIRTGVSVVRVRVIGFRALHC